MMSGARRLLGRKSKSASASSQTDWRVLLAARMRFTACFCLLWLLAIVGRLVQLQVVKRAEMVSRAERQQNRTVKAYAKRGDIVDRNGRVLAMSADADSVYAVPAEVTRDEREAWSAATVTRICGALRDCTSTERRMLVERLGRPSPFAFVRRFVDSTQASRISA